MEANLSLQQHTFNKCAVLGRLRRARRCVAAAAATSRLQRHSHVHDLSMVLLVNKNLEKHFGRGLVEQSRLLDAHSVVNAADYALLLVGNSGSSKPAAAATAEAAAEQAPCTTWPVLYTNQAALDALSSCSSGSGSSSGIGGSNSGSRSSTSSGSSSAGETQHIPAVAWEHVQLPAAVSALIQQGQQQLQRQQPLHHPQQSSSEVLQPNSCSSSSSCAVLQHVEWQPLCHGDSGSLTVDQLLCCQVHAPNDAYIGLALLFDGWRHADGCLGLPGWPRVAPDALPSQQQLQAAGDAVRAQADAVRQLKQGQGLSNQHPAVLEAVAALQQLKQQLTRLEGLQHAFMPGRERQLQQLLQQKEQKIDGHHEPAEHQASPCV